MTQQNDPFNYQGPLLIAPWVWLPCRRILWLYRYSQNSRTPSMLYLFNMHAMPSSTKSLLVVYSVLKQGDTSATCNISSIWPLHPCQPRRYNEVGIPMAAVHTFLLRHLHDHSYSCYASSVVSRMHSPFWSKAAVDCFRQQGMVRYRIMSVDLLQPHPR